jgi:ankyrin repeat protein
MNLRSRLVLLAAISAAFWIAPTGVAAAQVAPSATERAAYRGLFAAAVRNDAAAITQLLRSGADPDARDGRGRTPAMVASHLSNDRAVLTLLRGGADPNLLDDDRYDIITIAAVANDASLVRMAVARGGRATNVTSPYDGTALIAAAHLGNVEAVRELVRAGAPLDHVNNLGWTAVLEAVILGDGGARHQEVVRILVRAGADRTIADREGRTPLMHAEARGYRTMAALLRTRLRM